MSRSEAKTKRRKVWVNSTNDGSEGFHEENAYWNRDDALDQAGTYHTEVAIRFIESRPGDVVLSREDVGLLRAVAHEHLGQAAKALVLALLRGGR